MLYSILKDDEPKNTVNIIKNILNDLHLELNEEVFIDDEKSSPVSVRLSLKNNYLIGTNGKGTSRENALASAYAEFIERLQNLILIPENLKYLYIIPDKTENENNIRSWDNKLKKYFNSKLTLYRKFKDRKGTYDKLLFCPFYSVKKQDVYSLPYNVISRIKGSNGMSAGNTLEEAIVQGLSEVCERYALRKIIINKKPLPSFPKETYLKYENIKRIINYFNDNGFNVHIKDASLDGKIPVVCSIIEDTKNNIFCPSFGAHPSLPIAIERTLTEFTQGLMLSKLRKVNLIGYPCYSKEKIKYTSSEDMYLSLFQRKIAYEKDSKVGKLFFDYEPSFNYFEGTWISENKSYNNKELLKFLTDKVLNIADDIYIRNVSFLGFPSVDIFVPELSDVIPYKEKQLLLENLDNLWAVYNQNPNKEDYNIHSLLQLAEKYSFNEISKSKKIFRVPFEYIALLCSIVLNDSGRAIKYVDVILGQNKYNQFYTEEQISTFKIIKDYYLYAKKSETADCIKSMLKKKYKKNDVDYAVQVIDELTYEMVLDIVLKKGKPKHFANKRLLKKLENKYKKNLPNQMLLKNIF